MLISPKNEHPGQLGGRHWPGQTWLARQFQSTWWATVTFVAAYTLFNIIFNLRYPGPEDRLWYLVPSLDVTALFIAFAILGFANKRIPVAVLWLLSVLCVMVRLLRIGDGMETRFYSRNFNLYMDLPLIPELVRLMYATTSHLQFVCTAVLVISAIGGLLVVSYHCWRHAAELLRHRYPAWLFLGVTALFALTSVAFNRPEPYFGVFGASIAPRLFREADFLLHGAHYRNEILQEIKHTDSELVNGPSDLAWLDHSNVYLFFVESYGETLLELPSQRRLIQQTFKRFERMAASQGYQIASSLLDSPTYGGSSWLAHATLGTAIATNNQFRYRVVCDARPLTLAWFFKQAGYRTVLAQPATTRISPEGDIYRFDEQYYAWNFDYKGPGFSWATMPDQYVLDFIHRKEIATAHAPLFIEYALISSHAPWNNQPPIISDSNLLGDGHIYNQVRAIEFPTSWSDMSHASIAYARSIDYDFRILAKYLSDHVHDSSLVIILGDHQPNGDITQHSDLRGVPIHAVSRNRDFIERFIAQGYATGMTPSLEHPRRTMDQFTPTFLRSFSAKAVTQTPAR